MTAPQPATVPLHAPTHRGYPHLRYRFEDNPRTFERGAALISRILTGLSGIPGWGTGTWSLDHRALDRGGVRLASIEPADIEDALDVAFSRFGPDDGPHWFLNSTAGISIEMRLGIAPRGAEVRPYPNPNYRPQWSCSIGIYEKEADPAHLPFPPGMGSADAILAAIDVMSTVLAAPVYMFAGYSSSTSYDAKKYPLIRALEEAKLIDKIDRDRIERLSWITGLPTSTPLDRSLLPETATVWERGGLNYIRLCEDPSQVTARQIGDLSEALGVPRIERIVDLTGLTKEQARAYTGPIFLDLPDAQGSS